MFDQGSMRPSYLSPTPHPQEQPMIMQRSTSSSWAWSQLLICCIIISLVASQAPENPLQSNCLAAPCTYKGECRDRANVCGDTALHCNEESLWVPACGGGPGLDKPTTIAEPIETTVVSSSTPIPTRKPTNRPTAQPTPQPIIEVGEPTPSPAAWWELLGLQDDQDNQQNSGVPGLTTGNEDGNSTKNETGWFDADTWGNREGLDDSNKDEGVFDKIDFWNNSASSARQHRLAHYSCLVLSVILTWAGLS